MSNVKIGVVYVFLLLVLIAVAVFLFQTGPPKILGFAIYTGACGDTINSEGLWELNATLNCGSGNGIEINSSNVTLECNNHELKGGLDANGIGLSVSADLTNTTIRNCNITNFYDPIVINANTNLNILNAAVEANNTCTTGNWTDLGNNTGCLDTSGPIITITNQTLYRNESLKYQVIASDPSGISNYSVNDTTTFSINSSGLLTNITSFTLANFTINISVTDTISYTSSEILKIEFLSVQEESEDDDDSGSSSSEGGSDSSSNNDDNSESSPSTTTTISQNTLKICGEDVAWNCTEWAECNEETDGQSRTCTKIDSSCADVLPLTSRSCCQTEWECTWNECIGGVREAVSCSDLNECNSTFDMPTTETCENMESSSITGEAIAETARPILVIKNNPTIFSALLVLIFVAIFVLIFRKKIAARKSLSKKANPDQEEKTEGNNFW